MFRPGHLAGSFVSALEGRHEGIAGTKEGTKDNNILPEDEGSLISPPDKSIT